MHQFLRGAHYHLQYTPDVFAFGIALGAVAANAGAIEVVAVPDATHLGVYPYVGGSLVLPRGPVTLIPALSIEWSPEFDRWGLVGTFTVDYAVGRRLGLDFGAALIHDQSAGDFGDAAFFLGAGPGVSIFAGRFTISPFVNVFHGLNVSGWAVVPGVNVGVGF